MKVIMLGFAVGLIAIGMGCSKSAPLQPIEVTVQMPSDEPDTVRVSDIIGFWKWKDVFRNQPRAAQYEFRENGQYVYTYWDSTAVKYTALAAKYTELGVWQLTPPNRIYFTIQSSTYGKNRDIPYFANLIKDGDYLWIGNDLWQRGKW